MYTDALLAVAAKDGDDEAFAELVKRYLKPLYGFAYRYVGDRDAAEDVVSETFLRAWKHLRRYDPARSFSAWLFAIARNAALDWLKKKKPQAFSALGDDEDSFAERVPDESEPLDRMLDRALDAHNLERAMERLHPDERTILLMHYRDALTFADIGAVMGAPLNTVKSRHFRALKKLSNLLDAPKPESHS